MAERTLYERLGCSRSATLEQITAEYRARVRDFHPDKQKGSDEEFQQLQEAKEILCDPSLRKHYDMYLAIGSHMTMGEWMANRERLQQTLHWAGPSQPTPAICSPQLNKPTTQNNEDPKDWIRYDSPSVSAFRNYEI